MIRINAGAAYSIIAFSVCLAAPSSAQTMAAAAEPADGYWAHPVEAPKNALELTLGTGYTQGLGLISKGRDINDIAKAGMSLDLSMGYRATPRWMFGVRGAYQFFDPGSSMARQDRSPLSAVGGIQASYHFEPFTRLDPWLQAGTGYRYMCECGQPGRDERFHAWEMLDAKVGLDVRVDRQLALAPMVGADVGMFFWNRDGALADPRVNTFIYAGIQGRIDLGESSSTASLLAIR